MTNEAAFAIYILVLLAAAVLISSPSKKSARINRPKSPHCSPQHIPSPYANRQGKSWVKQALEKFYEQNPELRAAWDKAEAGLIIIDDIYDTHPGFDFGPQGNYYDERREATQKAFLKVIADRKDDGAPIMIIHSRVHEEDVLRISAEDSDVIAVIEETMRGIEATMGVPRHMLGDPEWDLDSTLDLSYLTNQNIYPDDHYGGGHN